MKRWVCCALLMAACPERDRRYEEAKARYDHYVMSGVTPQDPRFAELLKTLEGLGADAAGSADAASLAQRIRKARSVVRAPLAVVPRKVDHARLPEVQAQLERCAALAAAIGRDGGVTAEGLKALDECRAQAERLDSHAHSH